jgi:hypothetical protein
MLKFALGQSVIAVDGLHYLETGVVELIGDERNFNPYGVKFSDDSLVGFAESDLVANQSDVDKIERHVCQLCGTEMLATALIERDETYYDWDDPGDGGSFLLYRTIYECRAVDNCNKSCRQTARVMRQIESADDGEMREAGWGAIGNGARGAE